jgi:hypothetical protein
MKGYVSIEGVAIIVAFFIGVLFGTFSKGDDDDD